MVEKIEKKQIKLKDIELEYLNFVISVLDDEEGRTLVDRIFQYIDIYNNTAASNASSLETKLGYLLTMMGKIDSYYMNNKDYPYIADFTINRLNKIISEYDSIPDINIPKILYSHIKYIEKYVGPIISNAYPISELENKFGVVIDLYNKCGDRINTINNLVGSKV